MREKKEGRIIFTSSGVGVTGFGNISPYVSSKGAIESLAKCLEIENQDYGITFHIMHPPLTNTASSSELPVPKEFMADAEKDVYKRQGYGYAKTSASEKEKWGKMIENYLHTSKKLQAVFLLIDIRHDPSANDKMMYDWMVYQGFTPIIIATKLDKIKRSQIQKNVKAIREGLKVKPGTVIIPFSSETKQGRDELWEVIDSFVLPQEETEEEDK